MFKPLPTLPFPDPSHGWLVPPYLLSSSSCPSDRHTCPSFLYEGDTGACASESSMGAGSIWIPHLFRFRTASAGSQGPARQRGSTRALQTCFHWEPDFEESFLPSALLRQAFSYCFRTYTTDQLGCEHFAESPVYQSAAVIDACLYRHIFFEIVI